MSGGSGVVVNTQIGGERPPDVSNPFTQLYVDLLQDIFISIDKPPRFALPIGFNTEIIPLEHHENDEITKKYKIVSDSIDETQDLTVFSPEVSYTSMNIYLQKKFLINQINESVDVNTAGQIMMSDIIKTTNTYIVNALNKSYPNSQTFIEQGLKISVDPITLLYNCYVKDLNVYPVFPIEITITANNQFIRNGLQDIIYQIKHNKNLVSDLCNIPAYEILYVYIVILIRKMPEAKNMFDKFKPYEYKVGNEFPKFNITSEYSNDNTSVKLNFYMVHYNTRNIAEFNFLLGSIIITADVVNTITYNINDMPQNIVTNIITPTLIYDEEVLKKVVENYNTKTDAIVNTETEDIIKKYLNGNTYSSTCLIGVDLTNLCISKHNKFYSVYQKMFAPPNNKIPLFVFVKTMSSLLVKYLEPKQNLNILSVGINPTNNFIDNWKNTATSLLMYPVGVKMIGADITPVVLNNDTGAVYYNLVSQKLGNSILKAKGIGIYLDDQYVYFFKEETNLLKLAYPKFVNPNTYKMYGGVIEPTGPSKRMINKMLRGAPSLALFTVNEKGLVDFGKLKDKNIYLYKQYPVYRYGSMFIRDAICYNQSGEGHEIIEINYPFGPALEACTEIDSTILDTDGDSISIYNTKYDTALTLIDDSTLSNLINSFSDPSNKPKIYYIDIDDSDDIDDIDDIDDNNADETGIDDYADGDGATNTVTKSMIEKTNLLSKLYWPISEENVDKAATAAGKGGRKHHKTKKYIKLKKNTHTIGKSILKNKKTTIKLKLRSKHTITNKRL